ncbi:hypothetical protein BC940DRAFT_292351 [Gongronella butleri]|nr:hypothetical protein BC940DRAFT_292351 [Gongronella butleri]
MRRAGLVCLFSSSSFIFFFLVSLMISSTFYMARRGFHGSSRALEHAYDYVVIGGGSGGLASARRASARGAKTLLIETQHRLGGTCVNVGCVPKKVMWNAASVSEALRDAKQYGFSDAGSASFDWAAFKVKRDAYVARLNGIYERNLTNDQVEHVQGWASFDGNDKIHIQPAQGDGFHVTGKHVLIAPGGHPVMPSIPGAEHAINSDGFFDLEHQPKRVAVVGTGYIGIELAGIFHTLGSQTTVFSRTQQILRPFDPIIKDNVLKEMQTVGVDFAFDTKIHALERDSPNGPIRMQYESAGKAASLDVDTVLWATGRAPNVSGLNLASTGIQQSKRGHIVVDDYQNTTVPGVYALGDVAGNHELTPVAIAAGRRLADRLFGGEEFKDAKLDYSSIPTVIFSHPTAGTIGLTEQQARDAYGSDNIKVYTSRFTNMWFAMLEHKEPTAYKLVVAGPEERVVGVHLFGRGSDEILQGFGVAVKMGATKKDFDSCVAIHPTAAEELVTMK